MPIDLSSLAGNRFSGLISGIDSNSLIRAAVAARQAPIGDLIVKQTEAAAQVSALKRLKGVLSAIHDLANGLRNPSSISQLDQNAFLYRNSSVTGSPTGFTNASDLLSVTVDPGAQEANYTIEITQLAQKEIEIIEGFGSRASDLTDGGTPEVAAGTFQINGVDIVISSGATLNDIRSAINALSTEHGVTANIITITPESSSGADDGEYQLQLISDSTGVANNITFTNFTTVFPGAGGVTVTQTQPALDASIEFNGNTITRSTNTIDDVVDNVTFDLLNAEVGTNLTVSITRDTSVPRSQINNLVAGINNYLIFSAEQQARDPATGEPLSSSILINNPLLRAVSSAMRRELSRDVEGIEAGDFNSFSDIGFEFDLFEGEEVNGNADTPKVSLLTDTGTLGTQLINQFNAVKNLFELSFNATGANDVLELFSANNALTASDFTIDIDVNQPAGQRVTFTVDGTAYYGDFEPTDSNDLTAGGTITGVAGTPLEGVVLVYTGDGTESGISATITQGVGSRLYNMIDEYISSGGIIDTQISLLQEKQLDLQKDIDRLNTEVFKFQESLQLRYTQLEATIFQANSTLQFLEAQTAAINGRSG